MDKSTKFFKNKTNHFLEMEKYVYFCDGYLRGLQHVTVRGEAVKKGSNIV